MTRDEAPVPASYGADLLVLQPRDPWWIHAYWELQPQTIAAGRTQLGSEGQAAQMILRVYQEGTPRSFDVTLSPEAQDWFIEVKPAGLAWRAEIGLRTPSGRFVALARSNAVRTPPSSPSGELDEQWGSLPFPHWAMEGAYGSSWGLPS